MKKKPDKYDKELEKAYADLKAYNDKKNKNKNDLLQFFVGLLMLGAGLFMIFQNLDVRSSWGTGFWHIGPHRLHRGL